jgi:hypothetical protein
VKPLLLVAATADAGEGFLDAMDFLVWVQISLLYIGSFYVPPAPPIKKTPLVGVFFIGVDGGAA